jgi:hypothetical protein
MPVKKHNEPNKSNTADVLEHEGDEKALFSGAFLFPFSYAC